MINWNKYIKYGKFKTSAGLTSYFKFEFNYLNLEKNKKDSNLILSFIKALTINYNLVSIYSINPNNIYFISDYVFYPKRENSVIIYSLNKPYIIYDDVISTTKTILKCINHIGKLPVFLLCLVNRTIEFNIKTPFKIISISDYL